MKNRYDLVGHINFFAFLFCLTLVNYGATAPFDTAQIEQITGLKGTFNEEEDVFKVASPRTDVTISVDVFR